MTIKGFWDIKPDRLVGLPDPRNRVTIHFRNFSIYLPLARLQHSSKPHIRVNTDIRTPKSRTRHVIADSI